MVLVPCRMLDFVGYIGTFICGFENCGSMYVGSKLGCKYRKGILFLLPDVDFSS